VTPATLHAKAAVYLPADYESRPLSFDGRYRRLPAAPLLAWLAARHETHRIAAFTMSAAAPARWANTDSAERALRRCQDTGRVSDTFVEAVGIALDANPRLAEQLYPELADAHV
jgi:hypothetical protein